MTANGPPRDSEILRKLLADGPRSTPADSIFAAGGAAAPAEEDPLIAVAAGDSIGDFRLIRPLGRGGMGQVWLADQASLGRHVALKLVRPERVNERTLALFAREARAGGRLVHANVVAVYAHGVTGGVAWIAMELVESGWTLRDSLDELLKAERLPPNYYDRVARFVRTLAAALEEAHRAGVIHRDLKPQNILITPDDQPKLTDFGLAKITDETALSLTGDFAGTFFYMSPEQVAARRMGIDHRTDLFSLGVVLYEMLVLRRPFEGDTTHQVAQQILVKDPPEPRAIRSSVPRDLAVICLECMEKDPDDRYASMSALGADLERFIAGEPITARPPGRVERWVRWVRRNPSRAGLFTLGTVLLIVASVLGTKLFEKTQEAEVARAATEIQVAAKDRASYAANVRAALLASNANLPSDAMQFLDACPEELRGWEWKHVRSRSDTSLTRIEGLGRSLTHLRSLPNRPWVAADDGGAVVVWNANTGREVSRYRYGERWLTCLSAGESSANLAAGFNDGSVRLIDAGSGESRLLLAHTAAVAAVEFSPDDELLLTCGLDGLARLWFVDEATEHSSLVGHEAEVLSGCFSADSMTLYTGSVDGMLLRWNVDTGVHDAILEESSGVASIRAGGDRRLLVETGGPKLSPRLREWPTQLDEYLRSPLPHDRSSEVVWSRATQFERHEVDGLDILVFHDSFGAPSLIDLRTGDSERVGDLPLEFSGRGSRVWAGGRDGTVFSRDVALRNPSVLHRGHTSAIVGVVGLRDGSGRFATASTDGSIRVWRDSLGEPLRTRPQYRGICERTNRILVRFGGLWTLDMLSGEELVQFRTEGQVNVAQFSPSGERVLIGLQQGRVSVWDSFTGRKLWELEPRYSSEREPVSVERATFVSEDQLLITYLDAHLVEWWPNDDQLRVVDPMAHPNEGPAVLQEAGLVAVALVDDRVRVWDLGEGREVRTLAGEGRHTAVLDCAGLTRALVWSPDSAAIYDIATGAEIYRLDGHLDELIAVSASPDGARLAVASRDRSVRVWDAVEGRLIAVLPEGTGLVNHLAFHPSEPRLASSSVGSPTVRIWDIDEGEELLLLSDLPGDVRALRFDRLGDRLMAGAGTDGVFVWNSQPLEKRLAERASLERELESAGSESRFDEFGTGLAGFALDDFDEDSMMARVLRGAELNARARALANKMPVAELARAATDLESNIVVRELAAEFCSYGGNEWSLRRFAWDVAVSTDTSTELIEYASWAAEEAQRTDDSEWGRVVLAAVRLRTNDAAACLRELASVRTLPPLEAGLTGVEFNSRLDSAGFDQSTDTFLGRAGIAALQLKAMALLRLGRSDESSAYRGSINFAHGYIETSGGSVPVTGLEDELRSTMKDAFE